MAINDISFVTTRESLHFRRSSSPRKHKKVEHAHPAASSRLIQSVLSALTDSGVQRSKSPKSSQPTPLTFPSPQMGTNPAPSLVLLSSTWHATSSNPIPALVSSYRATELFRSPSDYTGSSSGKMLKRYSTAAPWAPFRSTIER